MWGLQYCGFQRSVRLPEVYVLSPFDLQMGPVCPTALRILTLLQTSKASATAVAVIVALIHPNTRPKNKGDGPLDVDADAHLVVS